MVSEVESAHSKNGESDITYSNQLGWGLSGQAQL